MFRLLHYLEGPQELAIERKIFNISAFSISVFAFSGTLLNYIIGLHFVVIVLSLLGFISALYIYYLSRFKNKYSGFLITYYLILVISILGVVYFFNGGLGGTIVYIIIALLNVFIIVVPQKFQYWVVLILYLDLVILFLIEFNFPHWVTLYISRKEAIIDHTATLFYSMGLITYVIINFRKKMLEDREVIFRKNKEIEIQKNEIEASKNDLEKIVFELKERNNFIETLLQELSHRVKNNLQIVISLLDMQLLSEEESTTSNSSIQETKNRLTALILVHQRLYNKETGGVIYMPGYIKELIEYIVFLNKVKPLEEIVTYNIEPVELKVEKVISLGLIINEIITNSFKHAFQNIKDPRLKVSFTCTNQYTLRISDNGSGFLNSQENYKTGMSLINSLTKQLKGDLKIISETGKGSTFILVFK